MIAWQQPGRRIILASGSPRRKELLGRMGFSIEVVSGAAIDESAFITTTDLGPSLCRLAVAKGNRAARDNPDALVLSADTVVVCGNRVLGKPADRCDAKNMLRLLSGKCHQVITAVALTCREETFSRSTDVTTSVYFRELSDVEIDWYVGTNEPFDKAGAYGIQGHAMVFVDKIAGCFYNVVGLPVSGTIDLFKAFDARKDLHDVARN